MSFKNYFRIIFLREKIGSKKVGGKTTVRLSWRKGKWVTAPTGAGRGDEMGKEKQAGRGKLGPKSNGNIENCF
jgi:hypothetical protein